MADDPLLTELAEACTGEVTGQASLAEYTTLKVGGPARVLVEAAADDDLAAIGRACREHEVPWLAVGRGSNLLVSDAGLDAVVVVLGRPFRGVDVEDRRVRLGAAEPLPAAAAKVARAGLVGFAWAAAIPGTVGGAVRMNAGAHGGDMSQVLVSAELFRFDAGVREEWDVSELGFRYRHSELPDDALVVGATVELETGDADEIQAEISDIRAWRREHQPINEPNCGSVFTNPEGDSAGRLIDVVGGKTIRIGGAHVSELHANFIVTEPGATAADVRALIAELQRRVEEEHGVRLRPEVVMAGNFEDAPTDQERSR